MVGYLLPNLPADHIAAKAVSKGAYSIIGTLRFMRLPLLYLHMVWADDVEPEKCHRVHDAGDGPLTVHSRGWSSSFTYGCAASVMMPMSACALCSSGSPLMTV